MPSCNGLDHLNQVGYSVKFCQGKAWTEGPITGNGEISNHTHTHSHTKRDVIYREQIIKRKI